MMWGRAGLMVVLVGCFAPASVRAATIAILPLESVGVDEGLNVSFRALLEQAFNKAPHQIVSSAGATYQVGGAVRREKSVYDFELKVTESAGHRVVAEQKGECLPCSQTDALRKFRVMAQTLQLKVSALPPPDSVPPEPAVVAPTIKPSPLPPPAPAPAFKPVRAAGATIDGSAAAAVPPSRWWTSQSVVGLVAATLALGSATIHFTHHDERCPTGCAVDARRALGIVGIGTPAILLAEASIVELIGRRATGRISPEVQRLVVAPLNIAIGLAMAGGGMWLLHEDGYGAGWKRTYGIVTTALAPVPMLWGIEVLAGGEHSVRTTAFVGPGSLGLRGSF